MWTLMWMSQGYGKPGEEKKVQNIKDVAWFTKDPVYGDEGPVLDV